MSKMGKMVTVNIAQRANISLKAGDFFPSKIFFIYICQYHFYFWKGQAFIQRERKTWPWNVCANRNILGEMWGQNHSLAFEAILTELLVQTNQEMYHLCRAHFKNYSFNQHNCWKIRPFSECWKIYQSQNTPLLLSKRRKQCLLCRMSCQVYIF